MTFSPYSPISLVGPQPQDQGLISWTFDPAEGSAFLVTAGILYLAKVIVRTQTVVSNLSMYVSTAGATLTANENLAGLYDFNGNLLGQTADQSTVWTSTGLKTMPLTVPTPAGPGNYWVGVLANGTTAPTFVKSSGYAAQTNVGLAAAASRGAQNGSGLTTLPSPLNPSANTSQYLLWAALS